MIGARTDNAISDGDHNTQIGHNAGTIQIGLTFEQHEAAVERAIARKEADLERAHVAEKALIQRELDELRRRTLDLEADYQTRLTELAETKAMLALHHNQIDRTRHDMAIAALDRGEMDLAESILTDLAHQASQRRDDAARDEAKLVFKLGEIAEARVDWPAAARHYARAAGLAPDIEVLFKAGEFAWLMGDYPAALRLGEELLRLARAGDDRRQLAAAMNDHALSLRALRRDAEAELLYREALEISSETLGPRHPDVATSLNNLAGLLSDTNRPAEAEPFYREALEISREALGPRHPDVAIRLNNLAELLHATNRAAEAEPLFREALAIGREALGPRHPYEAVGLNNLALLLADTNRPAEAEPLYREALEISRETLGLRHPDVAIRLNNLAWLLHETNRAAEATPLYLDALAILRAALGDSHPTTNTIASNTLIHLRQHAPDHPDLPALAAAFP